MHGGEMDELVRFRNALVGLANIFKNLKFPKINSKKK
jgi:hypothetical protein